MAGRPSGFSGAVGDFRSLSTSADRTDVEAEDSIRFTVRIECEGECRRPPPRFRLQRLPEFAQAFAISDEADQAAEPGKWTFNYILRPLNPGITEIPALRFDYYRPGITPPEKGYQTRFSDALPLKVRPRAMLETGDVQATDRLTPDSVLQIVPMEAVVSADKDLVELAEAAFRRGLEMRDQPSAAKTHFATAANHYHTLQQRGYHGVGLLLNFGNASLLADDLPHSILAYRQGLRIAPNDRDLRNNLEYARTRVVSPTENRAALQSSLISLKPIFMVVALCGLLVTSMLLANWWRRRTPRSGRLCVFSLILLAAASLGWLLAQREIARENRHPVAVIATDGVELRTGDGPRYPPAAERKLNRGVETQLLHQRGDWIQIELPKGGIGWVLRKDVVLG